jgi:alpha-tubulin suppressor-like RCC1 family protein
VDATGLTTRGVHSCALRRDGSVVCWGHNEHGQLGDGTTTNRPAPRAVRGL